MAPVRKPAWAGAVLGTLLLAFALLCGILDLAIGRRPMPRDHSTRTGGGKVRVAVLGDSQKGLANLSNLLREVLKERPDVVLHTGDLVSTNDEGHYRLAALYMERGGLRRDLVVVPGNHDVKNGTERFERELGPLERSFTVGRVGFVLLDNADGRPPDPARLESRIREAGAPEAVVLAMHVPPFDARGEPFPKYAPFLEWLERTPRVKYVLAGHVHAYVRKQVGGAVVIANGVGGDYESWQLSQKVYATILEIDGSRITDRTIVLPPEHGLVENLEHFAVGHFAEAYRAQPLLCWGGTVALAGLVAWAWRSALRRRPAARV